MQRKILAAAIFALFAFSLNTPAKAQFMAVTVASCGAESLSAGVPYVLTQDQTGKLCTSSSGGGGGSVTISQATPGTTNGVAIVGVNGATALAGNGQTGAGAQRVTLSQDSASVPINVSSATTTQLVALSGSTSIYVTSFDVVAAGVGNITFEYGTGTACATGTTALTGAYNLIAQAGIAKGDGVGTVLKVPSGNALCVLTSAAVQMSGSLSYIQF